MSLIVLLYSQVVANDPLSRGTSAKDEMDTLVELDDQIALHWKVSTDKSRIDFVLQSKTSGWAAFGLGKSMRDSDIFFCHPTENDGLRQDGWSTGNREPQPDLDLGGTQNLENLWRQVQDGVTYYGFSRIVNTTDQYDVPIKVDEANMIIFAWSNLAGPPQQHLVNAKGHAALDFKGGVLVQEKLGRCWNILALHGVTMALTWGFIDPIGIIIARFGKHFDWWLAGHGTIMQNGAAGARFFGMAAVYSNGINSSRPHAFMGSSNFVLTYIPLLTLIHVSNYHQNRAGNYLLDRASGCYWSYSKDKHKF